MSKFIEVELTPAIKLQDHKGKELVAYYLGKRSVETNKTESGESLLHIFQEKDGSEVEIWSFGLLKRKLAKVPIGSLVKLIYRGEVKDGAKTIHQVDVFYDETDKTKID
jgi:hypothetical protein